MDCGEKERDASAIGRQDVPLLMAQALDQSFPGKSPEAVAHLPCRVGRAEQGRDERTELRWSGPWSAGEECGRAIFCPQPRTRKSTTPPPLCNRGT
jgi:hypothetical protein